MNEVAQVALLSYACVSRPLARRGRICEHLLDGVVPLLMLSCQDDLHFPPFQTH